MSDITPWERGLGDMDVEEFRAASHQVADLVADYLGRLRDYPVMPDLAPGWCWAASVRSAAP